MRNNKTKEGCFNFSGLGAWNRVLFSFRSVLSSLRSVLGTRRGVLSSLGAWLLVLGSWHLVPFAQADLASTNYGISESYFPAAAAGTLTSTNYAVEESSIDSYLKPAASSTNYAAEGKVGIAGNLLPVIQSISPAAPRFYTDESAAFTVTAYSPAGNSLQYQVRQDGTIKDGPQSSNSLTWALAGGDQGKHTYSIEVLESGGTVAQYQTGYVFRKPVK